MIANVLGQMADGSRLSRGGHPWFVDVDLSDVRPIRDAGVEANKGRALNKMRAAGVVSGPHLVA